MLFVLDSTVGAAWLFGDVAADPGAASAIDELLASLENTPALVPSTWPVEMANLLGSAVREGRLTRADMVRAAELIEALPIKIDTRTPAQALEATVALACEHALSAHDAAYLELAAREAAPLATLSKPLAEAAQRYGVPLLL